MQRNNTNSFRSADLPCPLNSVRLKYMVQVPNRLKRNMNLLHITNHSSYFGRPGIVNEHVLHVNTARNADIRQAARTHSEHRAGLARCLGRIGPTGRSQFLSNFLTTSFNHNIIKQRATIERNLFIPLVASTHIRQRHEQLNTHLC